LSDAKGRYVAIHFLLKTECPLCLRHVNTYATRGPAELPDVVQLFLKPDGDAEIAAWAAKLPAGDGAARPAIYRDPDAGLATAFGIPSGFQFHGQTVHYPALVLIGPGGNEVFRYVGKDNADRLPFDLLKAKVADLKSKAAAAKP
jgi:peroxiredoxin Q/BCP